MDYETIKKLGDSRAILTVRSMLLAILLIGLTGTGAELLLLNHVESPWQWVPVLLILLSFVVIGWHGVKRGPVGIRAIECTMIAFIAAGFTGFYFHYRGSVEFKVESNRSLSR